MLLPVVSGVSGEFMFQQDSAPSLQVYRHDFIVVKDFCFTRWCSDAFKLWWDL